MLSTKCVCCTINFLQESDASIASLRQKVNEDTSAWHIRVREWCEQARSNGAAYYYWPKGDGPDVN